MAPQAGQHSALAALNNTKYRSRMMEHFILESAHRGPYVAGTVSSKQRTAGVIAAAERSLSQFDRDRLSPK